MPAGFDLTETVCRVNTNCFCLHKSGFFREIKEICMVIYEYVCRCDSRYVGRTTQRLQETHQATCSKSNKTKNHSYSGTGNPPISPTRTQPNRKRKAKSKTQFDPESNSAIGQHLLESNQCARNYSDLQFKILTTARSQFHLSLLEEVLYCTEKNRFVQAKAVDIHSTTVSVRSKPAGIG